MISGRAVGRSAPCLVIAEAGSNHDRKFEQALKLVDVAAEAGVDVVKFQTFSADELYSRKTPTMSYLRKAGVIGAQESVHQLLKRLELPREWHRDLNAYCRQKKVLFLSTPFDLRAVAELEAVGVPAYKIASFEINHFPLLEEVARTGKPILLSTGMADLADIERALDRIYRHGNRQVVLLHCASGYPVRFENVNLRCIETLRQAFQVPVGFSDHTPGSACSVAAVALGACAVEKHFTLSRSLDGPDHKFAVEPQELGSMVAGIRACEASLGSPIKRPSDAEAELHRLARRSLVAACRIPQGTRITPAMIAVKRPGFGIPTHLVDLVIGRTATRDIEEDDILTWDMI